MCEILEDELDQIDVVNGRFLIGIKNKLWIK